MDNIAVSDLYRQYKAGGRKIVKWLVETAKQRSINSVAHLINASAPNQPITLRSKDLLDLSRFIANGQKPTRPPPANLDEIISVVRYVISGRKECSVWYQRRPSTTATSTTHISHRHFIEVLDTVLCELVSLQQYCHIVPEQQKAKNRPKKKGKSSAPKGEASKASVAHRSRLVNNIYKGLEVEATAEIPDSPPATDEETLRVKPTPPTFERYELEADSQDPEFAIWCFFKECDNIRSFSKTLWSEYMKGEISLPVAAEVTSTAFLFIRHAAKRLTTEHPDLLTFESVLKHLRLPIESITLGSGFEPHALSENEPGAESTSTSPTFSSILCLPAFACVQKIHAKVQCLQPDSSEIDTSPADHALVSRTVSTYQRLCAATITKYLDTLLESRAADIFLMEIYSSTITRSIDVHVVAQAQIYMDIIDVVGDMRLEQISIARFIQQTSLDHLRHFETLKRDISEMDMLPPGFAQCYEAHCCKRVLDEIKVEAERSASTHINETNADHECPVKAKMGADRSLMMPVFQGSFVGYQMSSMHCDSIMVANCGLLVAAYAHLYSACKVSGLLKTRWEDMEFVIAKHASTLKVRDCSGASQPLHSVAKQYGLALGVDLRHHAKERTFQDVITRPYLPPLKDIMQSPPRIDITSPYLTSLKACEKFARGGLGSGWSMMEDSLYHLAKKLMTNSEADISEALLQQWNTCRKIEPKELLRLLKETLIRDEMQLLFPYDRFFYLVALASKRLRAAMEQLPPDFQAQQNLAADPEIYELVDEILWDGVFCCRFSKKKLASHSLLSAVAEDLEIILKESGSVCADQARRNARLLFRQTEEQVPGCAKSAEMIDSNRTKDLADQVAAMSCNDVELEEQVDSTHNPIESNFHQEEGLADDGPLRGRC